MASYADLLRNRMLNTTGTTTGSPVGVTVSGTAPSTTGPTGQNARIAQLFPEYIDPATGKPYQGPTTVYNPGGSRNANNSLSPQVTRQRTTPETHPWLYPEGGKDFLAGKDYANPQYAPGGIARGFPEIPQLSQAERQSFADQQNYFRNDNQGINPELLRGMSRTSGGDTPYRNQFGSFRPSGMAFNPDSRSVEFFGSRFSGQDQQGNPFSYTGQAPFGARQRQAAWGMAQKGGGRPGGTPGRGPLGQSPGVGSNPQFGGPTGGPTGFNQPPTGGSGFNQGNFIGNPQGVPPWLQAIMGQQRQAPSWWQGLQQQMFPTMGPGAMPVRPPGQTSLAPAATSPYNTGAISQDQIAQQQRLNEMFGKGPAVGGSWNPSMAGSMPGYGATPPQTGGVNNDAGTQFVNPSYTMPTMPYTLPQAQASALRG